MTEQNQRTPGWVVLAVIAAGMMSFAGVMVETAVNIAFPTLMREFGISTDLVQWMTTICLLTVTGPFGGRLLDRFGARAAGPRGRCPLPRLHGGRGPLVW